MTRSAHRVAVKRRLQRQAFGTRQGSVDRKCWKCRVSFAMELEEFHFRKSNAWNAASRFVVTVWTFFSWACEVPLINGT
jgi:hypothetical protein